MNMALEFGRQAVKRPPRSEQIGDAPLDLPRRPDVRSVVHAAPPHGTAFAGANLAIDQPILSSDFGFGLRSAYGGTPSTRRLTDQMQPFVKYHNALLMANHGAVAYSDNV